MLLSMTGHGEAHCQDGGLAVVVEVRTINSRYFKLSVRGTEGCNWLEPQVDSVIRKFIRRGTVQVQLRIDRESRADDYRLNHSVLKGYLQQLRDVCRQLQIAEPETLESLLLLPGVAEEQLGSSADAEQVWPVIEQALTEALRNLEQMRLDEGRAMATDLSANCQMIAGQLEHIEQRAPLVVESYRNRLQERLNNLLAEFEVRIEAADVVREVGVFAERCDISEEIVRLRSHLEQFESIMQLNESSGRKLDFLTQEMFRETNTIGSKANDSEIARHVIEIKAAIERIREMIQNVE